MNEQLLSEISLRRKRIAGLLLSEKTIAKKDLVALNLELYAATQAVQSAQRFLISEEMKLVKKDILAGKKKNAIIRLSTLEKLLKQL